MIVLVLVLELIDVDVSVEFWIVVVVVVVIWIVEDCIRSVVDEILVSFRINPSMQKYLPKLPIFWQ